MNLRKAVLLTSVAAIPLAFVLYPIGASILTGCQPQHYTPPPADPVPDFTRDLYSFPKFELPAAKRPGSTPLTVLSTVPEYKDTRNREVEAGSQVSVSGAAQGTMTREMAKVFKSFAGSVGEDVEAMMVAKGMTAKGPFVLDEITFPDKKGADLTAVIQLIFDIQYGEEKNVGSKLFEGNRQGLVAQGTMSVGVKAYYYLLEPLSEEKMWVKKLDLGSQDYNYELAHEQEQYQSGSHFVSDGCGGGYTAKDYAWRSTGKYLYDSRAKVFSDLLKDAYPQLMKTAWKYFDTEEMLALRDKAKEIREKWGSSSYRRGAPQ